MRGLVAVFLLAGAGLFAWVLYQTDLGELWRQLQAFGWIGAASVLTISLGWFLADVAAWHLVSRWAEPGRRWFARLALVHVTGEALNNVTPFLSFGGEPVKAMLLKRDYGIAYGDGVASLVLLQTTIVLAEIVFLLAGLLMTLGNEVLPVDTRIAGGGAFIVFSGLVAALVVIQRRRGLSRTVARAGRAWPRPVGIGRRTRVAARALRRLEGRLIGFYRDHPVRLLAAVACELANWILGAVEIWVALRLLGYPAALADAWVIEAAVVLVRNATFVVPSSLGAQDATFLVIVGLITGSPTAGIAVAVIRRFRELVWTASGLIAGGLHAGGLFAALQATTGRGPPYTPRGR